MLIREGKVSDINYEKGTVKVVFPGIDDFQSPDLQVTHKRTFGDKHWDMPDLDEEVLVILPDSSEGETGYVLCSYYNKNSTPPANDNRFKYIFKDGTFIEYNKKDKKFTIDCQGDIIVNSIKNVEVKCKNAKVTAEELIEGTCKTLNVIASTEINLTAPVINLKGLVNTTDNVNVAKDVITSKGSVNAHNHSYNWQHDPGASKTAPMYE
ncbi:MAG: phage baseplate assembly protein V [Fusobacteriaceae bacterium]|nr:phage baseplate assembly protein V [Fusobacteriaceae bacterium]